MCVVQLRRVYSRYETTLVHRAQHSTASLTPPPFSLIYSLATYKMHASPLLFSISSPRSLTPAAAAAAAVGILPAAGTRSQAAAAAAVAVGSCTAAAAPAAASYSDAARTVGVAALEAGMTCLAVAHTAAETAAAAAADHQVGHRVAAAAAAVPAAEDNMRTVEVAAVDPTCREAVVAADQTAGSRLPQRGRPPLPSPRL